MSTPQTDLKKYNFDGRLEVRGDTPEAPCFGLEKDKDPYRSTPHKWRLLKGDSGMQVCDVCGGMKF